MDFFELSLKRESCRDYTGEAVPREALDRILEAGRLAPSACNSQPWHFYVADNGGSLEKLKEYVQPMGSNKFTSKAGALIAIVGTKPNLPERVGNIIGDKDFSSIDIGIAVANMTLAARDLGYGTCILGMFYEDKIKVLCGISPKDKRYRVRLVLAVGRMSVEVPRKKTRKSAQEVVTYLD